MAGTLGMLFEAKKVGSLYALIAIAFCILVFTYNNVDFFNALLRTFFTSIAFYILGIVSAYIMNFVSVNAQSKDKE